MLSSSRLCVPISRIGRRCLFTNVVKEDMILPFKYDFVTPELRVELEKRGVNPDEIDRVYNYQLQDDHEFNNKAIPRQNSPLWGYVYGTQLARLQSQLSNLTQEEEFARGYLKAHIEELQLKMRRYYPNLNYEGTERPDDPNDLLDSIEAKVTAQYIAENPEDFVKQSFGNNWFVQNYDDDDTYRDFLPRDLEEKLIKYYQYDWDCSTNQSRPEYVSVLNELESGVAPRVDALKNLLIPGFENLLSALSRDVSKESALFDAVSILEKSPSVVKDASPGKDVGGKLLDVLFGGNSKINATGASLLGDMFGCGGSQFGNKSRDEVASVLTTFDQDRVAVLYKAAQARQSLKSEPLTKFLLTVLLNGYPRSFSQFMCGTVSVSEFLTENASALDGLVAGLLENQALQKKTGASLKALLSATAAYLESKGVQKSQSAEIVSGSIQSATTAAPNVLAAYYRNCLEEAAARGDIVGQIDSEVMSAYMETADGLSSFYNEVLSNIVMPSVEGLDGVVITGAAYSVGNNTFSLLDDVVSFMKENGLLNADTARSAKGDLSSAVDDSLASFRSNAKELVQAHEKLQSAIQALKLDYEVGFDFDRIKNTYNPLDVVINADNV